MNPPMKDEPKCEFLWQQFDTVKRCTHNENFQPNMKLDGETPGFCVKTKCPLKKEPREFGCKEGEKWITINKTNDIVVKREEIMIDIKTLRQCKEIKCVSCDEIVKKWEEM